jgi:hypothetical protein
MNFKITQNTEQINSTGGTALIGQLLKQSSLKSLVNPILTGKARPTYSNYDILASYISLLAQGRTSYEDINLFKGNEFHINSFGIKALPSAERLRQQHDEVDGKFDHVIRKANIDFLLSRYFGTIKTFHGEYVPWIIHEPKKLK